MLRLRRLGSILAVALAAITASGSAGARPVTEVAARAKKDHAKDKTADSKSAADKDAADKDTGKPRASAKSKKSKASAQARSGKSPKGGQSIGAPNAGKLAGAIRLRGSRLLRQREGAHSWGLPALVRLVQYAAGQVAKKHKNAVLLVGDLAGRTGGPLEGHSSHQSGRDVDIGFFVMNSKGKPVNVRHFVAFDGSGKGRELPWANFDEARNWTLIESLLKYDKAEVRYLFVTSGLRAKLLAYAARKHVDKDIIAHAAKVMTSASDGDLHDDHVHVRIACPASSGDACIEEPTAHGDSVKGSHAKKGDDAPEGAKADAKADEPKSDAVKSDAP